MLTTTDIQQISTLLDQKLDQKLDEKLAPIHETLSEHGKLLRSHTKQLRQIKHTQDVMLDTLDTEQMSQRKRLNRIEDHLHLSPLR